ncbi:MAG: amidophosphoribosyltransferase, partial [Taibaiella sp.]|nr:amidophosphoribosyltransferase [Taibaiella sp.]
KQAEENGTLDDTNYVKAVYEPFTAEEISKKTAEMLRPSDVNAEVDIIYQSIEGLRDACPNNSGDWYFTGNYPTKGGNRVANKAFMNYVDKKGGRGY